MTNIRLTVLFCLALIAVAPLLAQYEGNAPFVNENGGLFINEISQGPVGTRQEYIEFVVVGAANAPTAPVNLEGWIIDDNNFPASSQGTAPGHSSFGACFSAIPPGSIILFYNDDEPNTNIPPDDPTDTNPQDGVYVVSHKNPCINTCNSNPIPPMLPTPPNPTYCPCTDPTVERTLWALGLSNDNDLIQIRDRCEVVNHVIYWDAIQDIKIVDDIENSPVKVKLEGNQRSRVIRFMNLIDDDWTNANNFDNPEIADSESPGVPNSPANRAFIESLKAGTVQYEGTIYDCEDTDAGDINLPTDIAPTLPIEIAVGEDIGAFQSDYSMSDELRPDALDFTFEYAFILTLNDAPTFTIVDYSLDGDFDFSQYPVGEYLVWGFSYIQTNGTISVEEFLESVPTGIEDILNYKECGFDADLDRLTVGGEIVKVIINDISCFELSAEVTDSECDNVPTGRIDLTVKEAKGTLDIDWNRNDLDGQLNAINLSPGTYTVTITDVNNCSTSDTFIINARHIAPNLQADLTTTFCKDDCGTLALTFAGTPPFLLNYELASNAFLATYNLEVQSMDTTISICPSQIDAAISDQVEVRLLSLQDNHCQTTTLTNLAANIVEDAITNIEQAICPSEQVFVNEQLYDATQLSGQEIILNGASNGCDSIINISLSLLPIDTFLLETSICATETIEINGTIYGATNLSGLENLPTAASNGCDSVVVVQLNLLEDALGTLNTSICENETLELNGTIYNSDNTTGVETLIGAAVNGCDSIVTVNLEILRLAEGVLNPVICFNEVFEFNGTIYDANTPFGTEVLTGAATNGCDSLVMVDLEILPLATNELVIDLCEEESIEINGTLYSETRAQGQEILTARAANGCDSIINVRINTIPLAQGVFRDTLCITENIEINGTSYTATNPTGVERLNRTDACDSLLTIDILFVPVPIITLSGGANVCDRDEAVLTFDISQPGDFDLELEANGSTIKRSNISDGDTILVSPFVTTTYQLLSASSSLYPCIEVEGTAVVAVSDLTTEIVVQQESCFEAQDGSIGLNIFNEVPPVDIRWSNGQLNVPRINNLAAGDYSVTISDAGGCETEKNITIAAGALIEQAYSIEFPNCAATGLADLTFDSLQNGSLPYQITLANQSRTYTGFPLTFRNLATGRYPITIEDAQGCLLLDEIEIPFPPDFSVDLGADVQINLGDSINLTPLVKGDFTNILWQANDNSSFFDTLNIHVAPTKTTVYQIQLTDQNGCDAIDQLTVYVDDQTDILLPNAFSPNGDNLNDYFYLFPNPQIALVESFQVFDRWGNLVYETTEKSTIQEQDGWNGNINGKRAALGTYVYLLAVQLIDGRNEILTGTFDLF